MWRSRHAQLVAIDNSGNLFLVRKHGRSGAMDAS
jgi:hypothetical protein